MKPAPQELYCEVCDQPATADDWIAGLLALICPRCLQASIELEAALDAKAMEHQP